MRVPRRLAVLTCLVLFGGLSARNLAAQTVPALPAQSTERAMLAAERYRAMLVANPTEGMALDRLWKYHEDHGSTADLIGSYRQAAEVPDAPMPALLVYGHLLKKTGRLDDAAKWYQAAAARHPTDPLPPTASAALAELRGDHELAAKLYGEALDKTPGGDHRRTDLLLKQGTAFLAAGNTAEAANAWEKIVTLNPGDFSVRRQLADTYEKNGLLDRAVIHQEYIEAHAGPAERATALRELGRLHEVNNQFDAARDALEQGVALTARDNWLHGDLQTLLIRLYQRAGRVPELAARWREAVESAPRDLGGYLRLAALAEAEGDAAGERTWLEKIVTLVPTDRENILKLAKRLAEAGELRRAADLYDGLLKQQPGGVDLVLARADLDLQLGQLDAAAGRAVTRAAQSSTDESVTTPVLNFLLAHHLIEASERMLRAGVARQPMTSEPALALAKFLFSQRRPGEAGAVLTALINQPGDAAAHADRLALAADAYREGGLPNEAVRCWQESATLRPDDPAPLLSSAEVLRGIGNLPAAAEQLEKALLITPQETERLSTEKKLFDVLRAEAGGEDSTVIGTGGSTITLVPAQPTPASLLDQYLAKLDDKSKREKTVENFLRLARWQAWAHHDPQALAAAEEVLALEPTNLPATELAAAAATNLHRNELAERLLTGTLGLAPVNDPAVLRRLAALKIQEGDNEEALKLFTHLQQIAPGSRSALTDLALAQQRLDRWFDALATWEQAYALPGATPAQRSEIRRPLLAACEHLEQFARATDVLLQAVDEQMDLPSKEDIFRQLADLAYKHGLGKPLQARFEERLRRKPDDYFTLTALAQLDREASEPEQAYRLSQRAHYSSPDPVRSLRVLIHEAQELGKTDDAVAHLTRMLALPGEFTSENLEKLADFQEENQEPESAAQTWNQLIARFPRDSTALSKAADYFERSDHLERARDLQRQVVVLDETDLQRKLRLAALETRTGNAAEALKAYENILERTQPEAPGDPWSPPDELSVPENPLAGVLSGVARGRMRVGSDVIAGSRSLMKGASADSILRLQTITEMSRLLFAKREEQPTTITAAQFSWLQRWQKAADAGLRNEPLHAFYYAGRGQEAITLLGGWLGRSTPDEAAIRQTFLAAGLRLGDYQALSRWTWAAKDHHDQTSRAEDLLTSLDRFLNTGGKPGPKVAAELFPATVTRWDLLWASAREFAELHWYAPAAELGERVLKLVPGRRATYAVETAEWELYGGSVDSARQALAVAVEEGGGWTFDTNVSPVFSALREYYLLLPKEERPPFTAGYLRRMHAKGDKPHAILAGVLLHGLAGEEKAACHNLDALLAMRMLAADYSGPSTDARRWAYLLAAGVQLQSWNLDALAVHLWRQALKEATAFDEHFGDAGSNVAEIRRRLLAAEVASAADPETANGCVKDYLDSAPPTGTAAGIAGELMNSGRYSAAIQIDEHLCRAEPLDGEHWRSLVSAYEAAGDFDRLEQMFESRFEGNPPFADEAQRVNLVCRRAAVREQNGDPEGACRVLAKEQSESAGAIQVSVQLAQTYARAGRYDQAAGVWRSLLPQTTGSDTAILGLADLEERRGRRGEAIKLLEVGLTRGAAAAQEGAASRLARLYVSTNQADDACQLARTLVREGRFDSLPNIAAALAGAGRRTAARELLVAAVGRAKEPNLRFQLQQALVDLYPAPGEDIREYLRAMKRLEIFARDTPAARNNWEIIRYKSARRAGANDWLEKELRHRWDAGKGDYTAGERLAAFYVDTHQDERLCETIEEFDHRALLPDQLLFGLENSLVQSGHAPLALPISERLYKRFPQNLDYALGRAAVLWKCERRDEASRLFDVVEAGAVLRDEVTERAALFCLGLGAKDRAQACFERVVRGDRTAARSPGSFLQLARLYLDAGRTDDAAELLRVAYRQDVCDDFHPLVDLLAASGRLDGSKALEMPAEDFPLSFRRRALLLAAVFNYLNQHARADEARSLWLRYPEFLAEAPGAAVELCKNVTSQESPRLIRALRFAEDQLSPPMPRLARTLQALVTRQDEEGRADKSGAAASTSHEDPGKAP